MAASSPLAAASGKLTGPLSQWSPYGLCSSPPARRRTVPSSTATAKDRFIPCRAPLDSNLSNYLLAASHDDQDYESSPSKQDYINTLKESVLHQHGDEAMVLPLRAPASDRSGGGEGGAGEAPFQSSPILATTSKRRRTMRFIPKSPDKILDAPDLVDDYYLNLLDWSKSNILAVALRQCVFLWNASTGATQKLLETTGQGNIVTSLARGDEPASNTLSVGTHAADVQLWDIVACRQVRSMHGHRARVSSLSWNAQLVSSGSRDSSIHHHDVRVGGHHVRISLPKSLYHVCVSPVCVSLSWCIVSLPPCVCLSPYPPSPPPPSSGVS